MTQMYAGPPKESPITYMHPQPAPAQQTFTSPPSGPAIAQHWVTPGREQPWSTGLFDCFADFRSCAWGFAIPCLLYSKTYARLRTSPSTAEHVSFCNSTCWGHACCGGAFWQMRQRSEIRYRYGLIGSEAGDICTHYCCGPCALCQEEREVKAREDQRQTQQGYQKNSGMVYGH